MNWRSTTVPLLVLILVALAFWLGRSWSLQWEWSDLDQRQRATILRLKQFPPPGISTESWNNEIITLHNVWGNVTYTPTYSGLSNADMQTLLSKLNQLVNKATPENSVATVDRVYALLLERATNRSLVTGYRAQFRETFSAKPAGQ
jgi:hypothetical protein